jgi:hypothetical protein
MEWYIYGTHDPNHMIAVCPTCHDEIHHGRLPISDETLYKWKSIERSASSMDTAYLTVEPGRLIEHRDTFG